MVKGGLSEDVSFDLTFEMSQPGEDLEEEHSR